MSVKTKELSKITKDGLFEVFRDGTIFRFNEYGKKTKCPQYVTTINGSARIIVSAMVKGKQKHFYVSRLVAEVFLENDDPMNKTIVMFKDQNSANVNAENLYWASPKQMSALAWETRIKNPFICTECGNETTNTKRVCDVCLHESVNKERIAKTRNNNLLRLEKIREEYAGVHTSVLKPNEKRVLELRLAGCTLEEIGAEMGFTRERARQVLKNIKTKNGIVAEVDKNNLRRTLNRIATIERQIAKKELQINALTSEKDGLKKALTVLTRRGK